MTNWYYIRGGSGCMGSCSYCVIKRARGSLRSVPPERIIKQTEEAVRTGSQEICLTGTDMGCYGQDIGTNLPELLGELVKIKGDFCLNINYIEPYWLLNSFSEFNDLFKTGRIKTFNAPLQSGSQRMLDLMHRKYNISDAVKAINSLLDNTKLRSISSIVMVGFPGETKDDFKQSYDLLKDCKISMYQVLKYEGRPGTESELLPEKVNEEVKENRQLYFATKMKLSKFLGISDRVSEHIVHYKLGDIP